MNARWLLPLVVIAALLVGAAAALAVKNGFGQSAPSPTSEPTVIVLPTNTPEATSEPNGQPTAVVTSQPLSPSSTAGPSDPTALYQAKIKSLGYTPQGGYVWVVAGNQRLYAWRGVCSGSADGHCQNVFFFLGTRYLGTDTAKASSAITNVAATDQGDIQVTYPKFLPNDPLCCPSGSNVVITYHWNGSKIVPSGVPPGHE